MLSPTIALHLSASWPGFAVLLVLLALVKILVPVFFKDRVLGAMRVFSALRGLDAGTYRHFHDIDLPHPTERATIRIEHVVLSPFGIFVIDTTTRRSGVFDFEQAPEWFQRIVLRWSRSEDPVRLNRLKVDALMKFLNLPDPPFRPVVVFAGDCELKAAPAGMVSCDSLIHWIRRHTVTMLDSYMVKRAVARFDEHQESLNRKAAEKPELHGLHVRQAV